MVSIEAHCAVSGILDGRRNEAFIDLCKLFDACGLRGSSLTDYQTVSRETETDFTDESGEGWPLHPQIKFLNARVQQLFARPVKEFGLRFPPPSSREEGKKFVAAACSGAIDHRRRFCFVQAAVSPPLSESR
jgi:hypothetical protein